MARPRKPIDARRDRKIILWVNDREHARYLINAAHNNQTAPDYARALLCTDAASRASNDNGKQRVDRELSFARVDALNRLGATVDQLLRIADKTGHMPSELDDAARKIDALLDQLLPS